MATENTHAVDFRLTRNLTQGMHFIFAVLHFTKHCAKIHTV